MIIVEIVGGIGNQMFGYMLYLALKEKRDDVKLSGYWFEHILYDGCPSFAQKYLLDKVFVLSGAEYASDEEVLKVADNYRGNSFARIRRKLHLSTRTQKYEGDWFLKVANKVCGKLHIVIKRKPKTKDDIKKGTLKYQKWFSQNNAYLCGYWQDFRYAKGIEDKIRTQFTFKIPLDEHNQAIANQMADKSEVSVSIHIRRGDYLLARNSLFMRLSDKYYASAMAYFNKHFENVHFYCISDDIAWCRENIRVDNLTYVDGNEEDDVYYKKMQLMSLCKHNIIANSTFSIWGAWLNANPDKIVIRPRYYYNDESEYPFPKEWIAIDNDGNFISN